MKQKDTVRKTVLSMARPPYCSWRRIKGPSWTTRCNGSNRQGDKVQEGSLEMFKQGGRQDLVEQNEKEIEILVNISSTAIGVRNKRDNKETIEK